MNFSPRHLEERMIDPESGDVITEWEPARLPDWLRLKPQSDKEWRDAVRELNARAKAEGSYMRYRSVAEEQSW